MGLRSTGSGDLEAVAAVNRAAFGSDVEAALAVALMHDAAFLPDLSIAAVDDDGVLIGHVLFTRAWLVCDHDSPDVPLLFLAPLAVVPEWQGRGVGTATVGEAIARARIAGEVAMVVLGDPAYYGRFGFAEATPRGVRAPHPVSEYGWQVLELSSGALGGAAGTVRVAPPLDDPELWREPDGEKSPAGDRACR